MIPLTLAVGDAIASKPTLNTNYGEKLSEPGFAGFID
jgi:hypothetical protein